MYKERLTGKKADCEQADKERMTAHLGRHSRERSAVWGF